VNRLVRFANSGPSSADKKVLLLAEFMFQLWPYLDAFEQLFIFHRFEAFSTVQLRESGPESTAWLFWYWLR
jgi:hypothetical protein